MIIENTERISDVNTNRICSRRMMPAMSEHLRLREARTSAGYPSAVSAAEAMGVGKASYTHHENGTRGFRKDADRYARFFRVDLNWLLTGRGDMQGRRATIPLMGIVSAGSTVLPVTDPAGDPAYDDITLPERGKIAGLLVKGDSMYPRFLDGEYILYDPTPISPRLLLNSYAVIQTLDGRVMIKKLKSSPKQGMHRLWSHNAPEEDVEIMACHRVLGVLMPA